MTDYRKEYEFWCTDGTFDLQTRRELLALADEEEIKDRFYRSLGFGTGGLRGMLGAGDNRMNVYTVGKATQGLADHIRSRTESGSVVIAYDSRRMSPEFALGAACVLAANGIKAYLFESLRPTPELSFAVRFLHATAGIVITASHNPPQYNGYKVYWSDGGQIVPPCDGEIIARVNAVAGYGAVRRVSREEAEKRGLLVFLGEETDRAYLSAVKGCVLDREAIEEQGNRLKIVYTPLNGAGNLPVRRVLGELGFGQVLAVPEQEAPDGEFPTLEYPNPEDPKAFALALALAKREHADLVLATDPDADRLGVYALDRASGEYMPFTGNMSGLLIAEYELSMKEKLGLLPARRRDGALVTTVVSSKMAYDIAKAYGLSVIEVLTGFKYIGEQIKLFEETKARIGGTDADRGAYEYLFGFEESYGCLVGTHARDKDAVAAAAVLCEAAAHYAREGLTLWDQMLRIYRKYGYYAESLSCLSEQGAEGAARIARIMEGLRRDPPETIGGARVLAVRDYLLGRRTERGSGNSSPTGLPESDVLYYELEKNGWCCVRPSGTEPKIKFYFGAKGTSRAEAEREIAAIREDLMNFAGRE